MNILPCEIKNGQINFEGKLLPTNTSLKKSNFNKTQVGIRPEFVNFSNDGIAVKVKRVSDTGRHKVIDTECESGSIKISCFSRKTSNIYLYNFINTITFRYRYRTNNAKEGLGCSSMFNINVHAPFNSLECSGGHVEYICSAGYWIFRKFS